MGLMISALRCRWHRLRHIWVWRWRYWWLDTPAGAQAQALTCCVCALVVIVQLIYAGIAALAPSPAAQQYSIVWWVAYLIVALVAAAVSFATRPKIEDAKPTDGQEPITDDGQSVQRYWGTHWIGDEFELAWKVVGRDPIKASGGK